MKINENLIFFILGNIIGIIAFATLSSLYSSLERGTENLTISYHCDKPYEREIYNKVNNAVFNTLRLENKEFKIIHYHSDKYDCKVEYLNNYGEGEK